MYTCDSGGSTDHLKRHKDTCEPKHIDTQGVGGPGYKPKSTNGSSLGVFSYNVTNVR